MTALRVLLVEQNIIFALAAEDMLQRNGAALVHVASTPQEALHHLEGTPYDVALVDLHVDLVAAGGSVQVAQRLQALGIPFAFAAGYGERAVVPPDFADRLVVGKPYNEPHLLSCLARMLRSRA